MMRTTHIHHLPSRKKAPSTGSSMFIFLLGCAVGGAFTRIFSHVLCAREGHQPAPLVSPASQSLENTSTDSMSSTPVKQEVCDPKARAVDYGQKDPWSDMKWVLRPAPCPVNNVLIEELDRENNFRRGFSLGFHPFQEDMTHILPWMLASKVDLSHAPRRAYLDLGANRFNTSLLWFLTNYPLDFTEIHAWEAFPKGTFLPGHTDEKRRALVHPINSRAVRVDAARGELAVPRWQLDRVNFYTGLLGVEDGPGRIDITRAIKELGFKPEDAVILKMDIEGSEWQVLERWLEDSEMASIIDELWVEVHYGHSPMNRFGWHRFNQTVEDATDLLQRLRDRGFYAHYWP